MRDFYDIKTLFSIYEQDIDTDVLKRAFEATCKKRNTENLKEKAPKIMAVVSDDAQLHTLWKSYQKKYPYATDISYEDIMESTKLSKALEGVNKSIKGTQSELKGVNKLLKLAPPIQNWSSRSRRCSRMPFKCVYVGKRVLGKYSKYLAL